MNVTLHLHKDDALHVVMLSATSGNFLSLRFGMHLSIFLPGDDQECAAAARAFAASLIAGAEQLEAESAGKDTAVPA